VSRNAAFHEVWGRTAVASESAPVVELYGVGSLNAIVCRGRIHGRTTGYGATYAFGLRPLSGASLSFVSPRDRRVSGRCLVGSCAQRTASLGAVKAMWVSQMR
jgi:hypothetical protein